LEFSAQTPKQPQISRMVSFVNDDKINSKWHDYEHNGHCHLQSEMPRHPIFVSKRNIGFSGTVNPSTDKANLAHQKTIISLGASIVPYWY